jgi:hypothetical protein
MKNRALLLSAVSLCFAVAGCDPRSGVTKPAPPPTPPRVADTPSPPPPAPPPASADAAFAAKLAAFKAKYPEGDMNCKNGTCTVDVTVGAGCAVRAVPPQLGLQEGEGNLTIIWTIRSSSGRVAFYENNGINADAPKDPTRWATQFRNPRRVSDTEFRWVDLNTVAGEYGYNIWVNQDGKLCKLDPIIINGF